MGANLVPRSAGSHDSLPSPRRRHLALNWIEEELAALEQLQLRRTLVERESAQSPSNVRLQRQSFINFAANDYLSLAADARLANAANEATQQHGWGGGASPLVTGRGSYQTRLEETLAEFEGEEAALLFGSGYAANSGTIAALVGKKDAIFSDAKNHASIIDGCRLSRATTHIYRHNDVDDLAEQLSLSGTAFRRRLIVTDSLFSMDGDLAPLPQLAQLAADHDAMLMIDEAHATGVFGENGRGVAEHLQCEDGVHVRVGTLSKALGSLGGFVSGQQSLIDFLANRARPFVFSTALPDAVAAASLAALEIVKNEPNRRIELLRRAADLRQRLQSQGWNTADSASQIIPIRLGSPETVLTATAALREHGLLVPGIRPPTVPQGESLLRISLSYGHSEEAIQQLIEALARVA